MGVFEILFKAKLDGVCEVFPQEDMRWYFIVSCSNCNEVNDREIYFSYNEQIEVNGTRGVFNFAMKCKVCSKGITMNFVNKPGLKYSQSEQFQKIAEIESRGGKVVSWRPSRGFCVVSESGTAFLDVNFEELDWVEYDEQAAQLLGVYEIETLVQ
jgi:Eukaryotic protein of unknown function (DUF866)